MDFLELDLSHFLPVTRIGSTTIARPDQHVERRIHEYILYFIQEGSLTLMEDGVPLELTAGDVCLFYPGEEQRAVACEGCTFSYLHFLTDAATPLTLTDEELEDYLSARQRAYLAENRYGADVYTHLHALLPRRLHLSEHAIHERMCGFFRKNAMQGRFHLPLERVRLSFELAALTSLLEEAAHRHASRYKSRRPSQTAQTVRLILDYVENHYAENFTGEDVERLLLINFDYANRIFKTQVGYPIMQYRTRLRITNAKCLLGLYPIREVAERVGFANPYYFSRCFLRQEGMTPEEYTHRLVKGEIL